MRREIKYLISEDRARATRDFIRSYLELDEHAWLSPDFSYPTHSLYLDSPTLALCNATKDGLKNRFKLRVRFYDERPDTPVYFEIKRRINSAILKERAGVRRSSVQRLLAGHWPSATDLVRPNDKEFHTLSQFMSLRDKLQARGKVVVSYRREAYVAPADDDVRLTLDRFVRACHWDQQLRLRPLEDRLQPEFGGVVLELKFTNRYPRWMEEMIRIFDLQACSVAKYVSCVSSCGPLLQRVG